MGKLFEMTIENAGDDYTTPYCFTIKRDFTLDEFFNEVVRSDWGRKQWGYIDVKYDGRIYSFGYACGDVDIDAIYFPDEIRDLIVKDISGYGGYNHSTYKVTIGKKENC